MARTLPAYSRSPNPDPPHRSDRTRLFCEGRRVVSRFCEKDIPASPMLRVVRGSRDA
ncbi:hypothetical protein GCM10020256_71320 [Streptomyces thermocoprophilus]